MNKEMKFDQIYKSLDSKIEFLNHFDLLNLQKAGKIGKIADSKMLKKTQAIKSILNFDIKNKFLICKSIYKNPDEYRKAKPDDIYTFKTRELNEMELGNIDTKLLTIPDAEKEVIIKEKIIEVEKVVPVPEERNKSEEYADKEIQEEKNNYRDEVLLELELQAIKAEIERKLRWEMEMEKLNNRKNVAPKVEEGPDEQTLRVKQLIKQYDENRKRRLEEDEELKKQNQLMAQYEQKLIAIKNNSYVSATPHQRTNPHGNCPRCNQNDDWNKKIKAINQISKFHEIDEIEYAEDIHRNRKIVIFKGK